MFPSEKEVSAQQQFGELMAYLAVPEGKDREERKDDTPSSLGASGVSDVEAVSVSTAVSRKRKIDYTVRDRVRGCFKILNEDEGGSYDKGGVFLCIFCENKRMDWASGFNVSIAKDHLVEECVKTPNEVKDYIIENSFRSFRKINFGETTSVMAAKKGVTAESKRLMASFVKPNYLKSTLDPTFAEKCIRAKIEELLSFFDSPVRVNSPISVSTLQVMLGSGINKYVPSDVKVWDIVANIDRECFDVIVGMMKLDGGQMTVGFDGVTALGRHATLYTVSKGSVTLFLTIRYLQSSGLICVCFCSHKSSSI